MPVRTGTYRVGLTPRAREALLDRYCPRHLFGTACFLRQYLLIPWGARECAWMQRFAQIAAGGSRRIGERRSRPGAVTFTYTVSSARRADMSRCMTGHLSTTNPQLLPPDPVGVNPSSHPLRPQCSARRTGLSCGRPWSHLITGGKARLVQASSQAPGRRATRPRRMLATFTISPASSACRATRCLWSMKPESGL
jgi:hypothetical protein